MASVPVLPGRPRLPPIHECQDVVVLRAWLEVLCVDYDGPTIPIRRMPHRVEQRVIDTSVMVRLKILQFAIGVTGLQKVVAHVLVPVLGNVRYFHLLVNHLVHQLPLSRPLREYLDVLHIIVDYNRPHFASAFIEPGRPSPRR